jgi:hypothetical protein
MDKYQDAQSEMKRGKLMEKVVSVDPRAENKAPATITMTDGPLIPKKGEGHVLNSWKIHSPRLCC